MTANPGSSCNYSPGPLQVVLGPSGYPSYMCAWTSFSDRCIDVEESFLLQTRPIYFVVAEADDDAQCGPCVGDPINPASGAVVSTETDVRGDSAGGLEFKRYYNSKGSGVPDLAPGWRHSFSRTITPRYASFPFRNRAEGLGYSSAYNTPEVACTSGFPQIASRLNTPAYTVAAYANGVCKLTLNGATVGTLRVYSQSQSLMPVPTMIGFDAVRDDGQRVFFLTENGVVTPPPSLKLRMQQTANGYSVTNDDDSVETYDSNGKLLSIWRRAGGVLTIGYDNMGRLSTVTDSFGRSISVTRDGQGRIASVIDPAQHAVNYGYDASGQLSTVTQADGTTRTHLYENATYPNALTGLLDENGSRYSTWGYDAQGRATSTSEAGGAGATTLVYNSNGTVNVTHPLGAVSTFTFARSGERNLVARIDGAPCPTCAETRVTMYDANGYIRRSDDYNNTMSTYVYDGLRGLETSRTEASLRTVTTAWHPTHRVPTLISTYTPGVTAPLTTTSFTHDANGNVLSKTVTDPATSSVRTWSYTYNSNGRVLTIDGPRADTSDSTTFTHYACNTGVECGEVQTVTDALGHTTSYLSYNAHGQPLTIQDPNGVVTTLAYDLRQRLISRTIGTELTTFSYWPTGSLKKVTMPDGTYIEYTYDAAHRLTGVSDDEGNRIAYALDALGNITTESVFDPTDSLARTRTRVFNNLGQLWKDIGAAGTAAVTTTFGYDPDGNQSSVAAPLGRNTTRIFDGLNRLDRVNDPNGGVTVYGYNPMGDLISVVDPRNRRTTYTYTGLGDLKQQVSPDTGTTTNNHDSAGNLKTSTDARSKTATYEYDALNRVTSVTYADQVISYTYDMGTNQKGRLTQITDNLGSTSWSYDAQGRVLSRQQTTGAVSKGVGYNYDASGRLQTLTLPSGNTVAYGYVNGKVANVTLNGSTTLLSNVLYDPFGPTTGWTWGNSTLAVRDYNQGGTITLADSAGLKTYSYDDAFRITSITDATDPTLSQSYGYDLLDRLTSATGSSLNQSWTYDASGNRLTQGGSQASTYTVSPNSNRLTGISGALTRTYSHDNAGNITTDGSATFTYNDAGRMVSATKAGATSTYALNGLGQRVRKTTSGVSIYFVYDEAGHLIGEYDSAGNLIAETIWLDDIPVAVLKPNGSGGVNLFYVHTDHLDTPRRITRPSDNAIVWRWDSDPFGTMPANENPSGFGVFNYNLRSPGQYYDPETGLHYNYFRDYDPATGRYVQSDPIGLGGGLNTYAYVLANPISFIDPLGLTTLEFDVASGRLTVDPEMPGRKPYQIDATSGRGKCENNPGCERREDEGPIPRGGYYIDPNQIDNPPLLDDLRRNFRTPRSAGGGDWGDWRVRIYPTPGTQRFGRTGFYLHGGYFDGSAGCIDIGGGIFGDDRLLNDLRRDPDGRIPLSVR